MLLHSSWAYFVLDVFVILFHWLVGDVLFEDAPPAS